MACAITNNRPKDAWWMMEPHHMHCVTPEACKETASLESAFQGATPAAATNLVCPESVPPQRRLLTI